MVNKIEFHQSFLDIFTKVELKNILEHSMVATEKRIIIETEDNFFELSADIGDKLDIYCNSNKNGTERQLAKDEFMELYKDSPVRELHHINIAD